MRRFLFALFVVVVSGIAWVLAVFSIPQICNDVDNVQCQKNKERIYHLPAYRM